MQAEWKNLIDMNKCSHFIALISTLLEVGQHSYPMPLEQVVMHEMCIKHMSYYNYQNNQPAILFVNMLVTLPTGCIYVLI